ncbi:MAG: 1-(5-phosphoribosyl)-5-[(5-phosphoribosylamino)methylideneamino]imidazole-4-carboxamide isomerase [Thermodesulfobacteriota bacterium]
MLIVPAVDIKQGRCVRLLQGEMDRETLYSDRPADMAARWAVEGAELIHVVDLDGAFEKGVRNLEPIREIVRNTGVDVQVGGGIRDAETVEMYMDMGVSRVVIGSVALYDPEFVKNISRMFPGSIVVGIDARDGMVAVEGWSKTSAISAAELAKRFESSGVCAINFTDITRDGMQTGPNIEETASLAESVSIPVFASGGVSSLEDIRSLKSADKGKIAGVITGKALYEGRLDLAEAIRIAR